MYLLKADISLNYHILFYYLSYNFFELYIKVYTCIEPVRIVFDLIWLVLLNIYNSNMAVIWHWQIGLFPYFSCNVFIIWTIHMNLPPIDLRFSYIHHTL